MPAWMNLGHVKDTRITRRLAVASNAAFLGSIVAGSASAAEEPAKRNGDSFPRQDAEAVREVVGASHTDLEKVKQLVTARPALARASWDWGFGDWETPLGAASHMGRVDIARLLIEHGAQPDLFTHAMLGNLDAVRAAVEAQPGVQRILGPHGLTLAHHARMTGRQKANPPDVMERAAAVGRYLEALGDADTGQTSLKTEAQELERYMGSFRYGAQKSDLLHVRISRNGLLGLEPEGGTNRFLHRVATNEFAPSGAPAVRIRFGMENGRATVLTVHDPEPLVTAKRIAD